MATLWPASTLIIGCAAWVKPAAPQAVRFEGWRVLVMPSVFAASGLALLCLQAFKPQNALAIALATATLGAVIVRMAVTFRENIRLLATSRHEALTDALTGLGNRRKLILDLEQAMVTATDSDLFGLIVLDLDGFKQYNDRFGHPMGDALLTRLGKQLGSAVDGVGTTYRLGGDEFCVVADGSEQLLDEIAETAHLALSESGDGFQITSSCGQAVIPRDSTSVTHALHVADERLYVHKGQHRRATVGIQTSAALLQALLEREPELRGHLDQVGELSRDVGRTMGLFGEELEDVARAGQLHDVGKVAVPDAILQKPGALDASEWKFIHRHTIVGARILGAAPALDTVAKMVRASHERYDGNGYPDGLAGEAIPLGARIVSACDAYNSMTSERPYGQTLTSEEAIEELRRCAGEQFDRAVVEALCTVLGAPAQEQAVAPYRADSMSGSPSALLSGT
jgi:diguanylate cyclase (GGDEF)-like protein